jgi:hypothetical protein
MPSSESFAAVLSPFLEEALANARKVAARVMQPELDVAFAPQEAVRAPDQGRRATATDDRL